MSGRDINNILEIMKRDFKAAFSNPIVIVILIALIILPSLYAILNIQACWDPYENTNEIKFAISNLDNGTIYENKELNVGSELIKELENNTKFKWTMVNEQELRKGVHEGKYYAGIIIPKNLSENILSIISDNPQSAKLQYIVNVKANPVANKLTDSAANSVYRTMNAKIVEIINTAAYKKLGDLQTNLSSGASEMTSGAQQLSSGAKQVESGTQDVSNGASKLTDGASKVKSGSSDVNKGANKVKSGSKSVDTGSKQISSSSEQIKTSSEQIQQGAESLESKVNPSILPSPIKDVVEGSLSLANSSSQLASGSNSVAQGSVKLAKSSSKLANGAKDVANGASDVANGANDVATGSTKLADGALSLAAGSQLLSSASSKALISASTALTSASNSLADVTNVNESEIGNYFYSPVKLEREEEFPVDHYGSNITPFYLVLSMWVGAVITCVMLKPSTSMGTKYSPLEMYFGKLSLFVIMSILQATISLLGLFILGVEIENPFLFTISSFLVSIIFMVLIYSFISSLGQVGKGIGVILLVLQISGTGGIYPIEIMHDVFQYLYPFLPMTYAIRLIRESQLGIIWSNYIPSLIILLGIGIATIIIAVTIKEKADAPSHYLEERLEETGLF